MSQLQVAIIMGSQSDSAIMANCENYLKYFGIEYEVHILSAHRTPEATRQFAMTAEEKGFRVIIAAAGMAAHLPGVIAAHTKLPVIGVPLAGSELNGIDALYSIVQMPAGVPVATMAIGKAGAINAAVFAAEILAFDNESLKAKIAEFKQNGCKLK
ncbi:5-(carboxyamino)imidazole ribonucleotide mutase [candidate division KSB1 bacterium]|nr:5-(carboxyamino)imidazole ribonucleotide mutase [candidate division KSB1 bacterium]